MIFMEKIKLKDFSKQELEEYIVSLGEPKFRAKQIYKRLCASGSERNV